MPRAHAVAARAGTPRHSRPTRTVPGNNSDSAEVTAPQRMASTNPANVAGSSNDSGLTWSGRPCAGVTVWPTSSSHTTLSVSPGLSSSSDCEIDNMGKVSYGLVGGTAREALRMNVGHRPGESHEPRRPVPTPAPQDAVLEDAVVTRPPTRCCPEAALDPPFRPISIAMVHIGEHASMLDTCSGPRSWVRDCPLRRA